MRWFVLGLFADFCFRPDNLTESIIVLRLETFIASRHSFVAGCQQLSLVLLPSVKCFLFFILGQSFILNNFLRLIEVSSGIFNFVHRLQPISHWIPHCMSRGTAEHNVLARPKVPSAAVLAAN